MAEQTAGTGSQAWALFETEVLPHADRLFRLAMWLERDRAEAEDVVQETLVQAMHAFHRFQPGTNCRAWLATIMHNVSRNRRRQRSRSPFVDDDDERIIGTAQFVPPIPDRLTDEEILAALTALPRHYQEIVLLSDVEELTYKEIAGVLGVPVGTVMSRLHRGRALLRTALSGTSLAVRAANEVER